MKKVFVNALCLAIALLSGISLFILKYQVKEEERLLKTIHREILQNKREIHMLEAEWAHLNDPERLFELVKSQTSWETISAKQISMLSDIPLRPEILPAEPEIIETEEEKEKMQENPLVKEVVPISSVGAQTVEKAKTDQKPENLKTENTPGLGATSKTAAKAKGTVSNGVWKPAGKTTVKTTTAAKPAVKKTSANTTSKNNLKTSAKTTNTAKKSVPVKQTQSSALEKGTSALSTLLNKENKR